MDRRQLMLFATTALGLAPRAARAARCLRGPYLQNSAVGSAEFRWELDRLGASTLELYTGAEAPRKVKSPFDGRHHRVRLTC